MRSIALGLVLLLAAVRGAGGTLPLGCSIGPAPAATLLIPYFEVDLAAAEGATTLIAVTNAGDHSTLAHVVLWTDWGVPTLGFDLVLARDDVQTLNLRDVFAGLLPATGGALFPGCSDPVSLPALDVAALEALRSQHTGLPDLQDHCHGSGRGGENLATGYATVDATRSCSATIRYPSSNGYFATDESGIASNENVLLGDFFLVDSAQNLASGNEAVAIEADADRFGGRAATFYGAWIGYSGEDARAPLGTRYRSRFLNGGVFSGGTDLVVWAEPGWVTLGGVQCGERPASVDPCQFLRFTTFDESAEPAGITETAPVTEVATRLAVGSPELPTGALFGIVDIENLVLPLCWLPIDPPPSQPFHLQTFVLPLHRAEGRFSVGLNASRIADDLCPP